MTELKPCPFCGGEAHLHKFRWQHGFMFSKPYWQIICTNCRIAIGDYDTRAEAAEAWNARATHTCIMRADSDYFREELYPCNGLRCSNCDEIVWDTNPLCYCPSCGAKVVGA